MVLFMKTVDLRKDGSDMLYTRFLRKLARMARQVAGHCSGTGGENGPVNGHCY